MWVFVPNGCGPIAGWRSYLSVFPETTANKKASRLKTAQIIFIFLKFLGLRMVISYGNVCKYMIMMRTSGDFPRVFSHVFGMLKSLNPSSCQAKRPYCHRAAHGKQTAGTWNWTHGKGETSHKWSNVFGFHVFFFWGGEVNWILLGRVTGDVLIVFCQCVWSLNSWYNSTRWWFQTCFIFIPTRGNDPIWLYNMFQMV